MSAFVPSKTHYDLLVKTMIEGPSDLPGRSLYSWYPVTQHSPNELGETLLRETVRSVWYRYEDEMMIPDWAEQRYAYKDPGYRLTTIEFIKALRCYRYQSCEHPSWEGSCADEITTEAMLRAALLLIETHFEDEYENAPWDWTEEELQKRLRETAEGAS